MKEMQSVNFILIGDHKQLPAVILQNSGHSEVHDEGLRKVGLFNLKDSLFERLYRFRLKEESPKAIDMLCRQGRMHPGVAFFPIKHFMLEDWKLWDYLISWNT